LSVQKLELQPKHVIIGMSLRKYFNDDFVLGGYPFLFFDIFLTLA